MLLTGSLIKLRRTMVDRRPTLCSIFENFQKVLSVATAMCTYVGLHVKTRINNKHNNQNRQIYCLLEQGLYHNNNVSLDYRHSTE